VTVPYLTEKCFTASSSVASCMRIGGQFRTKPLTFSTEHPDDKILLAKPKTGRDGSIEVTIETRRNGRLRLRETSGSTTSPPFATEIQEAWYEHGYVVTAYNVCDEDDFAGRKVIGHGPQRAVARRFSIFGLRRVYGGTGKTIEGKFIAYAAGGDGWIRNSRGNPVWIARPDTVRFRRVAAPQGAFSPLEPGVSIAADPAVIPPMSRIYVDGTVIGLSTTRVERSRGTI
jgi:hypothetical protein